MRKLAIESAAESYTLIANTKIDGKAWVVIRNITAFTHWPETKTVSFVIPGLPLFECTTGTFRVLLNGAELLAVDLDAE